MFKIKQQSNISKARLGELLTPHTALGTPFFMSVATTAAVKTLDCEKMKRLTAQILLANTYHLYLRPGTDLIEKAGGLHKFMNWSGSLLTDSGGFQVFSLSNMRKITEQGASFRSHIDGSRHLLSPEKSMEIQLKLGSDILMVLDECPSYTQSKKYLDNSLELTSRWARRSKDFFEQNTLKYRYNNLDKPLLFGIVQGGMHFDLRQKSLGQLNEMNFDGMAIGGVSVGESPKQMREIISNVTPIMPAEKPRYVMGVGFPEQMVYGVKHGVDMYDCVIPTRHARHGSLFVFTNRDKIGKDDYSQANFYEMVNIKNYKYKYDFAPIDDDCGCFSCTNYSRAYVRYLFSIGEMLAFRLASIHNIYFYLEMMRIIRQKISLGEF